MRSATSLVAALVVLAAPRAAPAAVLKQFPISDPAAFDLVDPQGLTAGADGNLWFYDDSRSAITKMTPAGAVTRFEDVVGEEVTMALTAGPDGNIWFAEFNARSVGRITPSGAVTKFTRGITGRGGPVDIAAGADGNVWYTNPAGGRIGRVTPSGMVTEFSRGITPHSGFAGITAGPDGNVWFGVLAYPARIGRITPAGVVTEFSKGLRPSADPIDFTAGPDGNVWFADTDGSVGRVTPAGKITEFSAGIATGSEPFTIAAGPDGNIWFTESAGGRLGRVTPTGKITEFSAGLHRDDLIDSSITAGPNGALWFGKSGAIASLTPTPGTAVAVVTRRAHVSGRGATSATLACGTGTEPCAGSLELTITITETRRPKGERAYTVRKIVAVGSGRYALRPGQRSAVKVKVNASGLKRLGRRGRLGVRYRAASSAGDARGGLVLTGRRRG